MTCQLSNSNKEPWAKIPPRISRLADRLNVLAVELIEPILQDLPLHRILQLAAAARPTSRLEWAITNSPSWKPVFQGKLERLESLARSLSRLVWSWNKQPVHNVAFLDYHGLWRAAVGELRSLRPDRNLLELMNSTFLGGYKTLMSVAWPEHPDVIYPKRSCTSRRRSKAPRRLPTHSSALIDAIFAFVPAQVAALVDSRDYEALLRILVEESNDDDQSRHRPKQSEPIFELSSTDPLLQLRHRAYPWDAEQLQAFLPHFTLAFDELNHAKADQLLRLAILHDQYYKWLKHPLASQAPKLRREPRNPRYISNALRRDAAIIRTQMISRQSSKGLNCWYRFRNGHAALVPTDEALQMFTVHEAYGSSFPEELQADAKLARDGLWRIYDHDSRPGRHLRCVVGPGTGAVHHLGYRGDHRALPSPETEMKWLESMMRCVQWISGRAGFLQTCPSPFVSQSIISRVPLPTAANDGQQLPTGRVQQIKDQIQQT